MGTTKVEIFNDQQNRIADLAKAFAHPARVTILQMLIARKSCVCSDMVEELYLAQSTVSQHLKELKRIGIIKGEINPPHICYCINPVVWQEVQVTFGAMLGAFVPVSCCNE